eukprot:TRINITY_DN2176_c0_g1_i1.p2 TRINITY_DN2176_c0_g1~~TRINITY_DN2176_c0_g1_i1.p2  ORF type:complete len:133 (-),score=25.05 TRINITY_DN2176_c0_g1_i1:1429-1827(-)
MDKSLMKVSLACRLRLQLPLLAMAGHSEDGGWADPSACTFSLADEDHTLGNSARFVLCQDPRTAFCGYSIPHPSENRVNIRLQTTGEPARVVFKEALVELSEMCEHIKGVFQAAVEEHKAKEGGAEAMKVDK